MFPISDVRIGQPLIQLFLKDVLASPVTTRHLTSIQLYQHVSVDMRNIWRSENNKNVLKSFRKWQANSAFDETDCVVTYWVWLCDESGGSFVGFYLWVRCVQASYVVCPSVCLSVCLSNVWLHIQSHMTMVKVIHCHPQGQGQQCMGQFNMNIVFAGDSVLNTRTWLYPDKSQCDKMYLFSCWSFCTNGLFSGFILGHLFWHFHATGSNNYKFLRRQCIALCIFIVGVGKCVVLCIKK